MAFARQLEAAVVETIESGTVTRDLALIAAPKPSGWQTTDEFITAIAGRLRAKREAGVTAA